VSGVHYWFLRFSRGEEETRRQGDKLKSPLLLFSSSPLLRLAVTLLLTTVSYAQQRLTINGQDVAGLTTAIVSGSSYAPALTLADAIGGRISYDPESGLAIFDYASHLLSMRIYPTGGEAKADTQALELDGRPVAGTGAVSLEGTLYVPVKAVVAAFGGSVEYNTEQGQATVVFPRATLSDATVRSQQGYDRFVLNFDGLTPYQVYFNQVANILQVRFERLEPIQAQGFSGNFISNAILQQTGGYSDLVLRLKPETRYESYTAPRSGGFSFILDILPATAPRQDPVAAPAVVIDAGHGGNDPGLALPERNESDLTLGLAKRLSETLQAAGLATDLTRTANITVSIGERSQQGIGSSLYLSIHAADLGPGQINIFYLSEATDAATLELAIRENAKAALNQQGTEVMRRRLLLNLVPDMARGEVYANGLARELSQLGGYTVNTLAGLPLKVLEGAAGRGVLIEFNAGNLSDPQLATNLAAAIRSVLSQEGFQ
jgi:N-acetylmuramoyl-L-alanine amidase